MKSTLAKQPVPLNRAQSISNRSPKKLTSQGLFEGAQEIIIEHAGQDYRLRITRQNKLILTK